MRLFHDEAISRSLEKRVGCGAVTVLPADIRLDPNDLGPQFIDIAAQLLDPQTVQQKRLQAAAFGQRFVFFAGHFILPWTVFGGTAVQPCVTHRS